MRSVIGWILFILALPFLLDGFSKPSSFDGYTGESTVTDY